MAHICLTKTHHAAASAFSAAAAAAIAAAASSAFMIGFLCCSVLSTAIQSRRFMFSSNPVVSSISDSHFDLQFSRLSFLQQTTTTSQLEIVQGQRLPTSLQSLINTTSS